MEDAKDLQILGKKLESFNLSIIFLFPAFDNNNKTIKYSVLRGKVGVGGGEVGGGGGGGGGGVRQNSWL